MIDLKKTARGSFGVYGEPPCDERRENRAIKAILIVGCEWRWTIEQRRTDKWLSI
jgi:hypothetical protein